MQRSIFRGLAGAVVAVAVIGLAACAESLAPVESRAAIGSPSFDVTIDIGGGEICTPCPPGVVCAAVCETSDPEPVPEVAVDTASTAGTDATAVPGPAATGWPPSPAVRVGATEVPAV